MGTSRRRRMCVKGEVLAGAYFDAMSWSASPGLRGRAEAALYPSEPAHVRNLVWLEMEEIQPWLSQPWERQS